MDDHPTPPPKIGPHPSFIEVSSQYIFEPQIQAALKRLRLDEASEAQTRLQGCNWINGVRKALSLPVKTFDTACVFYHKFRLAHPEGEWDYRDAAAASLFNACKVEDTLKKSREILCAAYNLRQSPSTTTSTTTSSSTTNNTTTTTTTTTAADKLSPDNPLFDAPNKTLLAIERLVLESYRFDFRTRHPHTACAKIAHALALAPDPARTALAICLDQHRTFAPLKQTTHTLAWSAIALATRLHEKDDDTALLPRNLAKWSTTAAQVLETVFDLLDLYTHHRSMTDVGPKWALEDFIQVRIAFNGVAEREGVGRFTLQARVQASPAAGKNGSAPAGAAEDEEEEKNGKQDLDARTRESTVRFMLDPGQARVEKEVVREFWEVEEVEVDA